MGKDSQNQTTSAMEIDNPKANTSDQIGPKFSINVLQLLKSAQMQHGLRHGDYTRYRRYCTARLRRLYKSLKFTHGRGKYNRRAITESTVTEVRFLHVVLYTAERAWSHAMEKRQVLDGPNARQRIYLIGRLRKAVKWATLFAQLSAIKGDSRTSLEAEAYASFMKGNLLFEQDQNWDTALLNFKSARAVYEELAKYGDLENQALCRERVEELEPSIRYCLHKVGESNLQRSELLHIGEMEGPALDLFKAKLEAVMDEARSQQAASMTEFDWLGHRFPISNAKTRVSILKAQDLEKDILGSSANSLPTEKRLAVFDKIFTAYHEARSCIRSDLVSASSSENVKDDLSGLDKAIGAVLGQRTIEQNQLLVSIAKSKLTKRRDDKNERTTKPEELVRLYGLLLQNTADLLDLVSSGRHKTPEEDAFIAELEPKSLAFRAERCFFLGRSYSLAGKRVEAYALYCRARSLAEDALQKFQAVDNADQVVTKELKLLCDECRSNSCIGHATGIMEELKAPENLSKQISNVHISGVDTKTEKVVAESLACMTEPSQAGCKSVVTKFQQCPLLNISYCPSSEVHLSKGKDLVIVVYNSLGWKRKDVIKIPVVSEHVTVKDSAGKEIESQILPLLNESLSIRNNLVKAYLGISPSVTPSYWLAFSATVPPLGFSTYIVSSAKQTATTERLTLHKTELSQNNEIKVGPGNLKLIYSGNDGKLIEYTNSRSSVKELVDQSFSYYPGDDGTHANKTDLQASGAYIFRPNGTYPINSEGEVPLTVLRGPLLDEVHQKINSWIYQVTRVYKEKEHAEIEFTVGPIPIDDGIGKEIVTKITTSMKTNKQFYTDSNGRDFIERIRDYRKDWPLEVNQPVAGNYYPINLGIYAKDNNTEMSVLVDRSVGGSSIVDGQLELMIHRRLLYDDARGVGEALNETVCIQDDCKGLTVTGKYYLRLDPIGEGAKWRRSFGQEIYSPFLLAFTEQDAHRWTKSHVTTFSGMDPSYSLPDNVAIITIQELEDGKVLFRLAHLYEIEEDKDLSVMASVELKKVFANKKIKQITEMSLSANQGRAEMEKKRLVWKVEGSSEEPKALRGGPVDPTKLVVNLAPMEIRTFTINF